MAITTATPAPALAPGTTARRTLGRLRYAVGVAAAIALVAVVLPTVAGVSWTSVAAAVTAVPPLWLAGLVALWLVGLASHTITLTAAMPGLSHRRALTLSLTGSSVANVLPLGGAAGVALNYRMSRAWGFSGAQIGAYTVVSNAWDLLAKFVVPLLAIPALITAASVADAHLLHAAVAGAGVLAVVALLASATLVSPSAADRAGRLVDSLLARLPARWLRGRSCRAALVRVQASSRDVVVAGWHRLSVGMGVYTLLLFALMAACLTATGSGLGLAALLAGFAVERLLTLAGLTPGAAGIVEVGLTGTLLAFPGSALGVTSGVLLYRLITFGLEIPVGGLTLAGWWWSRRAEPAADGIEAA